MQTRGLAQATRAVTLAMIYTTVANGALSHGATAPNVALSGHVRSQAEGSMEGVVISAHLAGSPVTISVVSDKAGFYSFPADRLPPGRYDLKARAVGYELDPTEASLVAGETAVADLTLVPTHDLASQLTNAEWFMSVPGTQEQKESFLLACQDCHTLERVVRSTHSTQEWAQTITRMLNYANVSFWLKPQPHPDLNRGGKPEQHMDQAAYLSTINLSSSPTWTYGLKTLPRPTGRDTRVIVTEYQLPRRDIQPHDVVVDKQGTVWYADFGGLSLGALNPKTGMVTEYPIKRLKPEVAVGTLDLELDPYDGTLWIDMMFQGGIAHFSQKTREFSYYPLPKELDSSLAQTNMLGIRHGVDNKVWTKNGGQLMVRVDLRTKRWEGFDISRKSTQSVAEGTTPPSSEEFVESHDSPREPAKPVIYGAVSDSQNNLWMGEFLDGYLGKLDAKTGAVTWHNLPTPHGTVRRMDIDAKDVIVFAEYRGNRIGSFDTRYGKFLGEWQLPPHTYPYRPVWDKDGGIWTSTMSTDRVVRFYPKTGEFIQYLMPSPTNMRSGFIDNSTSHPIYWIGSNHGAAILKVEPL